ncbi:MAG: urease accessory protein UreF [Deltaproteobacteria bacterium]|nr:urease accessory protein UreF [Deltaproteobacteria bacterium]
MKVDKDISLVRLLQLASPALPVGAYSYSQGLEAAVEIKIIRDASTAARWIGDMLEYSIAPMEAPVLLRSIAAWEVPNYSAVEKWNALFLASRETSELRAETLQMGFSLRKLLTELTGMSDDTRAQLARLEEIAYPTAFGCAVAQWQISSQSALVAYLWSWLENQVMAAVKAVPLGQTDGQRMLLAVGARLDAIADRIALLDDDDLGSFVPGLALLSSQHETQYSRLFRS